MMQSGSHIIGNRNSTPDGQGSSLRPPALRPGMSGHHLRASADMGQYSAPASSRNIRPASEIFFNPLQNQNLCIPEDNNDGAQQWIADIDQYESTLEEMASATLDKDFKDELIAIEQWFKVLSEAERTSALYALLQQTTQVQIRFFIGVLQQMAKNHPMSGVLSPANFGERDAMSNRFNSAMSRLSMDGSRATVGSGRPQPSSNSARHSGLGQTDINSMFPDAAAAIAQRRADMSQPIGLSSNTNRHSMHFGDRSSLVTPTITTPFDELSRDSFQPPSSPWQRGDSSLGQARPRSSMGVHHQPPMGSFTNPAASARAPRPLSMSGAATLQNSSLYTSDASTPGLSLISPYAPGASWASMSNTPMVPNFNNQQGGNHADMVANATAMKLAALSTVNNRIQLDDVRKYRRARSSDGNQIGQNGMSGMQGSGLPANFIMTNELGQVLTPQQAALLQAQQLAAIGNRRSRPSSPALTVPGNMGGHHYSSSLSNGFLSAYDTNSTLLSGMSGMNLGTYGVSGSEGYISDASGIDRGRSPRGRRGSSKPPEDPTDLGLLKDIPNWLRSLRLHKYTDNLKDMDWRDLVKLDDAGLEAKGVSAVGARRKMLKVFEDVQAAQAQGKL